MLTLADKFISLFATVRLDKMVEHVDIIKSLQTILTVTSADWW
jgi:hypothetical protein